ncbi:MAG: PKD domain-containing protein, partial [Flavobacteriales bacterium]
MKHLINRLFIATVVTVISLISNTSNASHVPGGNITYECVGPNQFAVTLTLFEDCGTAFEGNFNQTLQVSNSCGLANPTLSLPNVIYQQEVSQLCPQQIGQSECSGGNLPGVYMHQWTGIITLPAGCDSWTFAYSSCCRNTAVNSTFQDSYYWAATLNSATAPCNNSAQITSQPIPYVCINQQVNFNMAAIDPDGDNLVFSLIPAMTTGPATTITYAGGYSGASPINGITINPTTGQITFTPNILGNFIVAVLIQEYDANGNLTGTVVQDFQFEVINCVNQVPAVPVGGITNYTGGGAQTGPNSIQVCEGDNFCFNLTFTDTDVTNVLQVTSNIQQIFPGAVVTTTGTNPVTVQVCHTVPSGAPANSIISFEVEDDACPIPGVNSFPITVTVINSTYAGMDQIMCLNQGAQLNANGGSNFNWTVLSGAPITIGTNFSCNNCPNPIANPNITTTYVVTSNLSGGCTNVDTVTINVVPDFSFVINQASPTSCLQDPINISVVTTPAGAFTYNWTPATYLSSTTSANVVANATAPGTYNYTVTITSPDGCVKTGTTSLVVFPAVAPTPTAFASPNVLICGGGVTQLTADLGGGVPATCGPSTSGGCTGPTTAINPGIQTGSNTTTSYPAIWGNWYKSCRHQMLFTAAELNAMGFVGGKITRINVPITQVNGTTTYRNVVVQIGCTSLTQFGSGWEGGLTTVFGPADVPIAVGNNYINFNTAYEWDGISNLILEICSDNTADPSWTQNSIGAQTTTPGLQCQYLFQDFASTCSATNVAFGSPSTIRPKIEFTTCPSVPDTTQFSYLWTPSANVVNPTSLTTNASPTQTTNYTVLVTNNNGGCTATASVQVIVDCLCYPANPTITNVSCNGGSNGAITAAMVGTTGPWTVNWYNSAGVLLQTTPNVNTTDILTGLPAGTYTIETIDTALCARDTTITITQPTAVTGNAGTDAVICINNSTTLSATATGGTPPYTFVWSDGGTGSSYVVTPAANTCYDVIATDANGCTSVADQVCIFLNPPILATAMNDATICPGASIALTATAAGGNGGPYTYTWTLNGTNVGTGSSLNVTPPANGSEYCVSITDNCGTPAGTDCVIINFEVVPTPIFTADNLESCIPLITNFTNTTNPALYTTATWNFGDGNSSTIQPTVGHSYTVPGCYDVTLTLETTIGCTATTTLPSYVCARPYPVASFLFGPQPTNLFAPDITFMSNSTPDAITFFYDFAGLGTSTLPATTFSFPNDNPGNYPVTFAVSNQFGCTDTIVETIIINGIYTIYAPNAFTPDGD